MVKYLGRFLSKQFVIPTIANDKSLDEDLTKDFNKSNKNAKTSDSIKTSFFDNNLHNTKSSQTQSKEDDEDTRRGYSKHDGFDRVGLRRIPSHKIVSKTKSLISICTDSNIFSSKLMVSSKYSCTKCSGDLLKYSKKGSRC